MVTQCVFTFIMYTTLLISNKYIGTHSYLTFAAEIIEKKQIG